MNRTSYLRIFVESKQHDYEKYELRRDFVILHSKHNNTTNMQLTIPPITKKMKGVFTKGRSRKKQHLLLAYTYNPEM